MYGYEVLHEDIAENLIENVRNERVQHAYIFEGENGVGSLEAARLFAAAMVCERTQTAPCGVCSACVMAKADTHPDVIYVKPLHNKRNITVDQIRKITADAYTKPFGNKKKVYIITEDMNEQAQNAFLKVLEEPPQYAVFILLSENHEKLLRTIRSRCVLLHFAPVSNDRVEEYLKRHYPEEDNLDFFVKYAGGVVGNAEKILKQENFIVLRNAAFDKLSELFFGNLLSAYDIAEFLEENKEDADLILSFWLNFVRDIILIQSGAGNLTLNTDLDTRMKSAANRIDEKKMVCAAEQLILAQKMRKKYVNLRCLALRLAFTIKLDGVRDNG